MSRRVIIGLALAAMFGTAAARPKQSRSNPAEAAAEAALVEGRKAYDLREWDRAIAKFKEAYDLHPDDRALFNIAQSYRLKGDCAEAAGYYKTYRRTYPNAANLDTVDKFIIEMDACVKHAGRPRDRRWMKWPGIAGLGVGALGLGLGLKFAVDGSGYDDQAKTLCAASCSSAEALALERKGHSANTKAVVFSLVGASAAGAGAVLLVMWSRGGKHEAPGVTVVPTRGGVAATYTFDF